MYNLTGKINSVAFSVDGKPLVTFEMEQGQPSLKMAQEYKDGVKVALKVSKYREKRSLDANAYYWSLLGKLAAALKISNNYCHNIMLRRYGVPEEFDGETVFIVIPDTDESEEKANESETYHIKPTANVREGNDGNMYRTYILLRGSHGYDTAEMSRLISGIRDECQQCGIPVETPEEIAQLLSLTGAK